MIVVPRAMADLPDIGFKCEFSLVPLPKLHYLWFNWDHLMTTRIKDLELLDFLFFS